MVPFKAVQSSVKRVFVTKVGETEPEMLSEELWGQIMDCRGEVSNPEHWTACYGEHKEYSVIFAALHVDDDEPATFGNVRPVDCNGELIAAGRYEVLRGGCSRLCSVWEGDAGELLCQFDGVDRVQRVDELLKSMSWFRCRGAGER